MIDEQLPISKVPEITHDTTPLMRQYAEIKQQYPDALVLFQVGDFYELFYDDAKTAASCLGIALTARGKNKGEPIPLCGVPVHALSHYLPKLINAGFHVVLCEQLEQPRGGMLVRRGVTRVYTPGTLTDDTLLSAKASSYILTIFKQSNMYALVFGELITARLFGTIIPSNQVRVLESELMRFTPDEILVASHDESRDIAPIIKSLGYPITYVHEHDVQQLTYEHQEWVNKQFAGVFSQEDVLYTAIKYFYAYMHRHQRDTLPYFTRFERYTPTDFLYLDAMTQRNLELVKSLSPDSHSDTLFAIIDQALTSMGSRMIRKWLLQPLRDVHAINQRLDVIEQLLHKPHILRSCEQLLRSVGDLERVVGRIVLRRAQIHDYKALLHALTVVPSLKDVVMQLDTVYMKLILTDISGLESLQNLLSAALPEDIHNDIRIKIGFDQRLDELRDAIVQLQKEVATFELEEQKNTGIASLKVRYNNIQGFYIEITKANQHLVPNHYQRQQTLVGRERYITPELQRLYGILINIEYEIKAREEQLFVALINNIAPFNARLHRLVYALAQFDALVGLARLAYQHTYTRPHITTEQIFEITAGRHPVVEQQVGVTYIPNSVHFNVSQRSMIITGPNMGGKSTFMRQTAIIAILAHMGSFVPAQKAVVPLFDRIFTRIGASDQLSRGKSTFLVEMEETSSICAHATDKSFVILDEVGRGTSTYDGLSIAQSVAEYIHDTLKPFLMFATHYHELTALASRYDDILNYHAATARLQDRVVLLHKIIPGVAEGSFGIEVARLAELPPYIIKRAQELLHSYAVTKPVIPVVPVQPSNADHRDIKRKIKSLSLDDMSPKQVYEWVSALQQEID